MDGVMQAPGGPTEGFDWPYYEEDAPHGSM